MTTRLITIVGFVLIVGAVLTLEVLGRRPQSRVPTAGEVFGWVMRPRLGRLLVLLGWLWLGWHYFAR